MVSPHSFSNYLRASGLPLSPIQIRLLETQVVLRIILTILLEPLAVSWYKLLLAGPGLGWPLILGFLAQEAQPGASTFLASPSSSLHPHIAKSCQWVQLCLPTLVLLVRPSLRGRPALGTQLTSPPGRRRRYHRLAMAAPPVGPLPPPWPWLPSPPQPTYHPSSSASSTFSDFEGPAQGPAMTGCLPQLSSEKEHPLLSLPQHTSKTIRCFYQLAFLYN